MSHQSQIAANVASKVMFKVCIKSHPQLIYLLFVVLIDLNWLKTSCFATGFVDTPKSHNKEKWSQYSKILCLKKIPKLAIL